ncbi:MAG TPA: ABC transporter permease [Puia sp.]|nr:ABC transporter permease [Puia sp.]
MFKSYWTIAWRTLVRNKVYTFVNVAGLALGICACLVIWVIVHYEFSFDRNHPDGKRIYRINSYEQILKNEREFLSTVVLADLPEAVRKQVPGVEVVAPYHALMNDTATIAGARNRQFDYPVQSITAGPEYFRIMAYDWLAGSQQTALSYPFSVVLTESRARLYFGNIPSEAVIGREVVYQDSLRVHVSGVVRDWTEHTDFPFTDFISESTVEHSFLFRTLHLDSSQHRGPALVSVLVKLAPKTDPDRVRASLSVVSKDYNRWLITRVELQPLDQVHFTITGGESSMSTAQLSTLYALLGIALFILALAIINYINLATAQSLSREKEISIRKVMGSGRGSLILQLLTETFILTALASLVAIPLVRPVLGVFSQFVPQGLVFRPLEPAILLFLLGITVFITIGAGLYPARLLSARSPVQTLNGAGAPRGGEKWYLRKGLIIFQFTVSLLFIIGTMGIGRQIGYMLHKDLGFRSDAIVMFGTGERGDSVGKARVLQAAIAGLPGVLDVARENMPPAGEDRGLFTIRYRPQSNEPIRTEAIIADEHYIPLYDIHLLAGRNLFPSDTLKEVVINESLSRVLGFRHPEEAVGAQVSSGHKHLTVVGVVADFHKYSYHEPIQPLLIAGMACTDIAVRLDAKGKTAKELRAIIARVEKQWKGFYPHRPFEYEFVDEEIAQMYQREQALEGLMDIATGIAVFISLIGLFGLTLFTTERRTKEIGIRKVLGARVTDILGLLVKDFLRLLVIALVIASAGGWYFMHRWLRDYAYRVGIGPELFLLAGGALLVVTVLTVGVQSLRAATVNPVRSLRSE